MRALLVAALLVAAPDREDPTPKETPKTPAQQILGDWRLLRISIGAGKELPTKDEEERTVQFTPSEILVRLKGELQPNDGAGYTLDTAKSPIAIDLTPKNGGTKQVYGILKIEGDQLTICFSTEGTRPASFAPNPQNQHATMELKRIKR